MPIAVDVDRMLAQVAVSSSLRPETRERLRVAASAVAGGLGVMAACRQAGVSKTAFQKWRGKYPEFDQFVSGFLEEQAVVRGEVRRGESLERKRSEGLVFDPSRPMPSPPGFADFRWDYFGQPTEPHQEAVIEALEDMSNRVVIILGPTGMGKDTIAGQYLLWRLVPSREGLRGAWFMESEPQSRRRLYRLSRYLVDSATYRRAPENTPGGQVPSRSLIDDWGPFRWEKGMVHADGSPVERPPWTSNAMYFLQDIAPEQDPNLWATGVQGATYGSRIQEAVLSDIFTTENQQSPTERQRSLNWVLGTLDTRLDDLGRLVAIGTMLPIVNNYEDLVDRYTDGARVLSSVRRGPGSYTKFSNGTAVVVVEAVTTDEEGREESYWERRFPLESQLIVDGVRRPVSSFSDAERLELTDAKWVEGLLDRRRRDPTIFKAMFQQRRDTESTGDFTEATFEAALDEGRTWEVAYPHELSVVGADPGEFYGGAYAVLAVDRKAHTITMVDEFWGNRLGISGIKTRLVTQPITRWNPIWYCYEVNRHKAVMYDATIQQLFKDFGVSLHEHKTSGQNRADHEVGVGSIASYMRSGVFRLPAMTAADRERSRRVWDHFVAYDQSTLSSGRRRPGAADHQPDDRAFATWTGFVKARLLLEDDRRDHGRSMPVPAGIRAKWERAVKVANAEKAGSSVDRKRAQMSDGRNASLGEVVAAFVAED